MGSEFVRRKSSVWAKKSDTKPSIFTSRSFSSPTNKEDTVNKKELPKEVPPPDYIFSKMGFNPPKPAVQTQQEDSESREEEQQEQEQPDVMSKSDAPPAEEEESKEEESNISPKSDTPSVGDEENKEEKVDDIQTAAEIASSQSEEEDERENLNKKSIQTKLTVGKPGDKYEQEADTTAAKVMEMSDETVQRQADEEEKTLQPKKEENLTLSLSPMTDKGEKEENQAQEIQAKKIQTKGKGNKTQVSSSLESRLGSSKGGGSPLPDNIRSFMEPRFGADFSSVNVHTDSSAVQMNKELGAQAFAHGNDIYYGAGKSPGNDELTAHELTHTIQQTGGKLQPKFINQIAKKENKVHTSAVFPVQMKEGNVEAEVERASPDSVENPQKEQQAGSAVTSTKEEKNSTSPENKDGTTPQQNAAVTGENPTSPRETTEDKADKSSKEETNAASVNSGDNPQKNQQASSKQAGDKQSNAAAPEKKSAKTAPASPDSDPDFKAVVGKAKGVANKEKKHEPANKKSQEAQDAAQSPASEVESKAQGNQVGEMEQAPTPAFNAAAFTAKLMERIEEAAPKNLGEADKFKDNNKLGSVKSEMQDKVKQEQTASQTPLEEKAKQAPDTSGIEPKSVTPLPPNEAGAATQNIGAQKAIPKAKGKGEVETPLQESSQKLDQQMADADVTEKQLAKSNEPQFQAALQAKTQAQTNANQAPQQYRQFEQNQLTQAKGEASATAQQQLQGMHGDRAQLLSQVTNQQVVAKGSDEQKRAKIAGDIQGIYQNTKTSVDDILKGIEGEVIKRFDAGTSRAKEAYENYVAPHMEEYKKRYDGIRGAGRWLKDELLGVPPKVTAFFKEGREKYLKEMNTTLTDIANYVTEQLNLAKEKIAEGRKEIKKYVEELPASLQQVGQDAANNIQSQFDQLEQSVDDKHNQLINTLSQAYTKNLEEMDARIEEMKASNQPWFAKAFDGLAGVIETINKLKNMLMKVLAKVADTVGNIIKDPISFLGNLISGIKQGFENFVGNIGKHLQSGLVGWLTGALGPMGIQLPDDIFSLPGIFSLTTQVLGLTFDYIRAKAVKKFGEPVVAGMEQAVEIFQILRDRGAMGLWEDVQEQFNDLKETVIEEIKNMVITQVITAGVKWVLSLLNPASAFVKAAMAIYDIIMFFVNRGSQVLELVNSVVDAVAAIASGAVGGAAKLVENALSRALPVVIGFLASLLGIGGLAKKVEKIIGRIRQRIDKAIDKVLLKAKKAFGKLRRKGKAAMGKLIEFWKVKKRFKTKSGISHTLFFQNKKGSKLRLFMASKPKSLEEVLTDPDLEIENREELLEQLKSLNTDIVNDAKNKQFSDSQREQLHKEYSRRVENLASQLAEYLDHQGDLPPTTVKHQLDQGKAFKVIAEPLTINPGNTNGQNLPSGSGGPSPLGWDLASQTNQPDPDLGLTSTGRPRRSVNWGRTHLLSEKLHGPVALWNLVPTMVDVNSNLRTIEHTTADRLKNHKILSYTTKVTYKPNKQIDGEGDEGNYPSKIEVTIKEKSNDGETYENEKTYPIAGTYEVPGTVDASARFEALKKKVEQRVKKEHKEDKLPTPAFIFDRLHLKNPKRPRPWLNEIPDWEIQLTQIINNINSLRD